MLYLSTISRIPISINVVDGGINAVDLFMAIIVAAVICMGRKDGIVAEIIKLIGIFFTVFITLHYYVRFADFLRVQFFGKDAETELFAFTLIAVAVSVSFIFITKGWSLILEIKSIAVIDRWGRLIFSLIRSYFVGSMVFLALILSQHATVTPLAQKSVCAILFHNGAVNLYKASYSFLIEKYFPGEKINQDVIELIEGKPKK